MYVRIDERRRLSAELLRAAPQFVEFVRGVWTNHRDFAQLSECCEMRTDVAAFATRSIT
jgi:hypothetical protein